MKLMLKGFLSIMLLASGIVAFNASAATNCNTDCSTSSSECNQSVSCPDSRGCVLGTKTHFSARPVHLDLARDLTADADKIHRFGEECFNGIVSLGLQYQQTRKPGKLASYFFGKPVLTYGNSCDGEFDIFGQNLGTVDSGTISFAPRIRNFVADFKFWFGLDELVCGLWTNINVPVNHTNWNLRPCVTPTVPTSTTSFFPAGAVDFANAGTVASFASVLGGLEGLPFGLAPAATCGKVCPGGTKTTNVSGLIFELGYDFLRTECGHFGAALRFVAPTGTRPNDNFLFNATTGSQHSWELGARITSSYLAWEGCGGDQRLGLFFDAVITHLFYGKQHRLFDLKKRSDGTTNPMSYWMLLKKFNPTTGAVEGLERAANILCCDVKVGAQAMADLALMVQYDCGCFSAAVGWDFWIRTKEKLKATDCGKNRDCNTTIRRGCVIDANTYGIKGSSGLGDVGATDTTTFSNATIGNCGVADTAPVYLTTADIDFCSALHPRAFSNKVFGWVGYNWRDCEWQPYVAVEGQVEFGHDNKALDQWGVMLKGGVAF